MRVGIVCPYSVDVAGGVQEHVTGLAGYLREQGHDVSVLAPSRTPDPGEGVVSAGPAVAVPYNGSVARLAAGPRARARTGRWLADGRFDLVHLHEPLVPSVSAIALRRADVPLVATFHTAIDRSRALHTAWPALRPALERVGGRIAVSAEALATVERHTGKGAVVVPNGVRTAGFRVDPDPRWTGTPERPTVAFLGRATEPRKGLPVLLAALPGIVHRHPGVRLLVAGPGGAAATAGLPGHLAAHVEVLGTLTDADRAALLASADVYVAPNTGGESFGIILVEAMAAGAPVVASDLAAFRAVLGDEPGAKTGAESAAKTGVGSAVGTGAGGRTVAVGDPRALADGVADELDAVADPSVRARRRAAARARAERYDWRTVGARVVGVYETVLMGERLGERSGPRRRGRTTRPGARG